MAERIVELRKELASNPASRQFYQLGELLRRQDAAAEAAAILRQGLEHHPRYVAAWVSLGRALVDLQDGDAAGLALERALELDPGNPVAWRLIGESRMLCGDRDGALVALERALALVPGDEVLEAAVRTLQGDDVSPDTGSGPSDEVVPAGDSKASEDAKEQDRPDVSADGAAEGFKDLEGAAVASQVPAVAPPGEEGAEAPGEAPAPVMMEAQAAAASTREQEVAQPAAPFGDAAEAAVPSGEDPFRAADERPDGEGDPFGADVFGTLPDLGHPDAAWDVFGPPPGEEPGPEEIEATPHEAGSEFPAAPPPGDLEITVTVPPPVPADEEEAEQDPFASAPGELEPDAAYQTFDEELPAEQKAVPRFPHEEVDEMPHEYPFAMPEDGEAIQHQRSDESAGLDEERELTAEEPAVPPVEGEADSLREKSAAALALTAEEGVDTEAASEEALRPLSTDEHPLAGEPERGVIPIREDLPGGEVGAAPWTDAGAHEATVHRMGFGPSREASAEYDRAQEAPQQIPPAPAELEAEPPASEATSRGEETRPEPPEVEADPPPAAGVPPTMASARAMIQQQQFDQAVAVLNDVIVNDPADQEARDLRSLVLDIMEPLDAPLPRLSVRERRIAALRHWLASITMKRDRTLS